VPVSLPFLLIPALSGLAGLYLGARLPAWPWMAAAALTLLVSALASARAVEPAPLRLLRHLALSLVAAAAPSILEASPEPHTETLGLLLGCLCAAIAGPDLARAVRILRASRRAGEDPLFQQHGIAPVALLALCVTWLALGAAAPHLGQARTLLLGGLLLVPWAIWQAATETSRRPCLAWSGPSLLGALTIALVVHLGQDRWGLPTPVQVRLATLSEAVAALGQSTLWVEQGAESADVRIHTSEDLVVYASSDAPRAAEALVHPAASALSHLHRALVLGNESGTVTREVLKYPEVKRVVHVSLVPGLSSFVLSHPLLQRAHGGALLDSRVVRLEARRASELPALLAGEGRFDLIAIEAWAPLAAVRWLLSREARPFFAAHLEPGGFLARRLLRLGYDRSAWCFVQESAIAGWYAAGYRVDLPASLREQHLFEISSATPFDLSWLRGLRVPTRYLTDAHLPHLFAFGHDEGYQPTDPSVPCASDLGLVDG
jgi:hypothetical protein